MKLPVEELKQSLAAALAADAITTELQVLQSHAVDDIRPKLICTPSTPAQLAAALKLCAEAGAAIIPRGGGTAMALGNPPRQADVVIKTTKIDRILDHDHANLTVTVASGITLAALQSVLAAKNQFVPFDPPRPETSTVGGIVAANLNGPRRTSYGSVRDLVIGMKVALASGEIIKAGGKVVKNVAGYDMCKLFTGSLGTVGIITELTLRVAPRPEAARTAVATGSLEQILQSAAALAAARLLPTALFLMNRDNPARWQLAVRFEGFSEAVERQLRDFAAIANKAGAIAEAVNDTAQQELWQRMSATPFAAERLIYRLTLPRGSIHPIVAELENWRAANFAPQITADMAAGVLWLDLPASAESVSSFPKLSKLAHDHHGHAILFSAPARIKAGRDVWGPAPTSLFLMRRIKQQFDPTGLLNPGRFVDFV